MAEGPLVFRVPGKGYFQNGRASLLGLEKDAYVSYHGGGAASNYAHIGLSFEAARWSRVTDKNVCPPDRPRSPRSRPSLFFVSFALFVPSW